MSEKKIKRSKMTSRILKLKEEMKMVVTTHNKVIAELEAAAAEAEAAAAERALEITVAATVAATGTEAATTTEVAATTTEVAATTEVATANDSIHEMDEDEDEWKVFKNRVFRLYELDEISELILKETIEIVDNFVTEYEKKVEISEKFYRIIGEMLTKL